MEAVLAENLTVDADVAKMAAGKLDGLNQRLRAKGKKQGAETLDEIRLDTPADRAVFLHQAEVAAKPGHVYYGGIASYYRAKFPSVDMDAAERLLAGQDVRGIARMAVALSEGRTLAGYSEHQPARGELQQLRGLLLAVYGQMKDGKISATDARFAPAERDGSTDILRQRETLLNIGLIILREIATDPDITSRKSNESYIGEIHIVDPDIKQGEITATRHMDAERLRRTHALRGKLDTPVLQVSVDGRLYAIEYRSPEGWTVVPPSDAMQGGK